MLTIIRGRRLVVGSVIAVLALVAGVVVLSQGGDDKDAAASPDPEKSGLPDGALAEWWHSAKVSGKDDGIAVLRMWVDDDVVVTATTDGVWGFDATTGKQRWELEVPEYMGEPCKAAPTLNKNGAAALLYGGGGPECGGDLVVFDTGSGEVLWDKEVHDLTEGVGSPRVSIGDKVVTVDSSGGFGGKRYRYSVAGEKLPLLTTPGRQECPEGTRTVQSQGFTLIDSLCDKRLIALDTQSGKHRWTRSSEDTSIIGGVIADSPLTVYAEVGGPDSLETFSSQGKLMAKIELPGGVSDRPQLIDDSVLVAELDGDDANFIAVDLKSGKESWRDTGLDGGIAVGTDDDQDHLLALAQSDTNVDNRIAEGYDCRLLHLDPLDDRQTEEGILPCAGASSSADAELVDAIATDKAVYLFTATDDSEAQLTAYKRPQ